MSRADERLDTRPDETEDTAVTLPRLGPLGMLRWAWRQLTSMRTALFLLLLLAIAAVPGSIWPQRNIDAGRVADYLAQHRSLGPWLDRLGFFDVYSSPWFAAIYLLLFVSLVGCVVPRSRIHWHAMRAVPPRAPRRLERLPEHGEVTVEAEPAAVLAAAREVLRRKRFRVHAHDEGSLSAESGYLRETGNLVFHLALIVVIIGIAVGHLFGWRGDVIVPVGETFSNTISAYDTIDPGPWVDAESLTPFSVAVDKLDVTFEEKALGAQRGAPRDFTAYTTTRDNPDAAPQKQVLKVNHPLTMGGASVFLLGNGYAPVVTVRDAKGQVLYHQATPFLTQDNNYKSVGAVKVSAASPKQLGFFGFFLPTAYIDKTFGPSSAFPDLKNPALALGVYEGELYPGGRPQSVYTLSTEKMTQLTDGKGTPLRIWLTPGKSYQLPGGRGSITFDGVQRFAGLSIRHDPGKPFALWGALLALAGLIASLMIRRRRVFVRVQEITAGQRGSASDPAGTGRTVVTIGALAKGEDAGLAGAVEDLLASIAERTGRTA
ncbi:cytochrome c biogenesis protein ResB [Oryzihumus leptocrescens]|uniref:Cytochrome c biogenesis protein n=1 Tax=Oryzihumus leptocrescens TaxID=297536 RepID=A0A542ZMV3_9MICO|nr:cytochrome c biogenesis protein ResB [Oryzihumus leptocrescens]TQL61724.1 cytochrome c biogenesis protein [Oryzihumus leptocrescens]